MTVCDDCCCCNQLKNTKNFDLLFMYVCFPEPGSAPRNVQVRPLSSSTMVIQWDEPEAQNGLVTVSCWRVVFLSRYHVKKCSLFLKQLQSHFYEGNFSQLQSNCLASATALYIIITIIIIIICLMFVLTISASFSRLTAGAFFEYLSRKIQAQ